MEGLKKQNEKLDSEIKSFANTIKSELEGWLYFFYEILFKFWTVLICIITASMKARSELAIEVKKLRVKSDHQMSGVAKAAKQESRLKILEYFELVYIENCYVNYTV